MKEKQPILKVAYWDHVSISGETKLKEVKETKPLRCLIYGELVREDEQSITVLSYQEEPGDLVATEHFAMLVLKSCIIERVELEEKEHVSVDKER